MSKTEQKPSSIDIVERLRAVAWQDEAHSSDLYDLAADRIEELECTLLRIQAEAVGEAIEVLKEIVAAADREPECVTESMWKHVIDAKGVIACAAEISKELDQSAAPTGPAQPDGEKQ